MLENEFEPEVEENYEEFDEEYDFSSEDYEIAEDDNYPSVEKIRHREKKYEK